MSLLKGFTQNSENRKLLENNLEESSFQILNQMSKGQIHLYIEQAQERNYELIIQTNPAQHYSVYREITGHVTAYNRFEDTILIENMNNNIVFVIPLDSIRFIRRS